MDGAAVHDDDRRPVDANATFQGANVTNAD
jgi:hypothetical protein